MSGKKGALGPQKKINVIPDLTRNPGFPKHMDSCFRRNDGHFYLRCWFCSINFGLSSIDEYRKVCTLVRDEPLYFRKFEETGTKRRPESADSEYGTMGSYKTH